MATLILRGLESKPKLNGRTARLVKYHEDRGRWEVELDGDLPPQELFKIEWHDDWWEPFDDDSFQSLRSNKGPTFKEELEQKLQKSKLLESVTKILVVDCNGKTVCVFDADGRILDELQKKHIPRKVDTPSEVCQRSFPLHFQRKVAEGRTLAVKPSSLYVREESASSLRKRKVEMSVGTLHRKPELDGQFALLGPFQAHANCWQVLPDARSLWDVKVDGSPTPLLLRSSEICDEVSGVPLEDPVRVGDWQRSQQGRALYASAGFQQGQIVMEEEPVMLGDSLDVVNLLRQYRQLSGKRELVDQLCQGPDFLRVGSDEHRVVTKEDLLTICKDSGCLDNGTLDLLWALMRIFSTNSFWHSHAGMRALFVTLASVNHSCRPNATVGDPKVDQDKSRFLTGFEPADPPKKAVIALRDIQPGEEITISYLSEDELLEPCHARRERLEHRFGFRCVCSRCEDEADDGLLRCFQCSKDACTGAYAWMPAGLSEELLAAEQKHVCSFFDFWKTLSAEKPLSNAEPLLSIAKNAAESGLAPDHWLVCRVRHVLACYYAKHGEASLAIENLRGIIRLRERVLGSISPVKTEQLGDQFLQQGSCLEAFESYASVLKVLKLWSPNTPPNDEHCERVRQKLRAALDGTRYNDNSSGYAKTK